MKDYTIADIEIMTEEDASAIALEKLDVKGHTIYMVDFGGYFGYSCLVFLNGHHIYHANDYAIHHAGKTQDELRALYLDKMKNILFTPEEIVSPLSGYGEYSRREYYLRNYYGMQKDHISAFWIKGTEQEEEERNEKIANMIYDPISFAYYSDEDFVREHIALFDRLQAVKNAMKDDFEYWKSAFKYEMSNHEYAINWQADYDTLRTFGSIQYRGDDENEVRQYFDELHFTETQRKAYRAARREYLQECEF